MRHYKTKSKKSLEEREGSGEEQVSNSYSCKQCNKIFQHFCQFMKHYQEHNMNPEKYRIFTTKHLQTVTKKKLHLCTYCSKKLTTAWSLKIHSRIHTWVGGPEFYCSYCGKSFKWKKNLKNHVRLHTGQRPFKCKICGKAYVSKTSAAHHTERKHVKGHECVLCNESFGHYYELIRHMSRNHTGEKYVYECKKCGVYFEDIKELKEHDKIHN